MKIFISAILLLNVLNIVQGSDTCPSFSRRSKISPGHAVCCDNLIKTVVETGLNTMDLFVHGKEQEKLTKIVSKIQKFVQKHFGVAFEIIMSPKDFQLNTHYNGTKMCKFQSNNHVLAVYETPGKYDINSKREKFFNTFASNDKLKIASKDIHNLIGTLRGGFHGSEIHGLFG